MATAETSSASRRRVDGIRPTQGRAQARARAGRARARARRRAPRPAARGARRPRTRVCKWCAFMRNGMYLSISFTRQMRSLHRTYEAKIFGNRRRRRALGVWFSIV